MKLFYNNMYYIIIIYIILVKLGGVRGLAKSNFEKH